MSVYRPNIVLKFSLIFINFGMTVSTMVDVLIIQNFRVLSCYKIKYN